MRLLLPTLGYATALNAITVQAEGTVGERWISSVSKSPEPSEIPSSWYISKKKISIITDRQMINYFFIHNYKAAGTTIYSQLPKEYNRRFYGHMRFSKYERRNNIILDASTKEQLVKIDNKISIDHIHIDNLVNLGILTPQEIQKMEFLFIFREPIDRFLSICNYENIKPCDMIENFKQNRRLELKQSFWINSRYPLNLTTLRLEDKNEIASWFERFSIKINLNKKYNVTRRLMMQKKKHLTNNQLLYLQEFFKSDFDHYHALQR
jgi:hypothetical protein